MAIFRLVLFLGFFPLIAFAITINPFSPKSITATWDSGTAGSISNAGGAWNLDAANFTYDNGIKNSPFCQGCNVSFGAAAGGAAGVVTVTGIQKINSFTFNSGPTGNFNLTGGEISCVNFSPCTYTANYSGTIGSVISGSQDLIKQGPQTLTLSGINTYTGNTNVNAGTLEATTNVEAIPGNLIIAAGATGHLNVTGNPTFSNNVSGQGTLKVTPGGTSGNTTSLSGNLSGLIGLFDIHPYPAVGGGKVNLSNTTQVNTPPIGSTIRLNSGATIFLDKALNYESNFELYGGTTGEALGQLRVETATVTGPVTLFANSSVGARVNTGTISGEISGLGFGLTKEGGGKITLTNANTYTGATTISGGTLQVDGFGSLGSGSYAGAISNSGTFQYSSSSAQTLSGVISGAGAITKDTSNSSTLTLSAVNTYTGATTVNNGTLAIINTPTLQTTLSTSGISIASGATLSINRTTNWGANNATNYNNLSGAGSVIHNGPNSTTSLLVNGGWTLLNGTVNLTGSIDVQTGILASQQGANWTGTTASLNVASGAQFLVHWADATVDELTGAGTIGTGWPQPQTLTIGNGGGSGTFSGVIEGNGNGGSNEDVNDGVLSLTKTGAGTQTLTGANTYTGTTNVNAGTLKLTNTNTSPTFNLSGGAILELNVPTAATQSVAVNQTFNGTGTIRKTGPGLIQWPPVGTYALGTGAMIDVQEGTFIGGNSDNDIWTTNLSDLNVASGATFNGVEANVKVDALTGTGTITSGHQVASYNNFTFGVDNGGGTFDGVLGNFSIWAGNFVKAGNGTQILTGLNTYTGTTTVSNGTLQISGAGSLNLGSYAGAISNSGTFKYSSSAAQTFSGGVTGTGALIKDTSTSILTLTGAGTLSGTTTVSNGTLKLRGANVTVLAGPIINNSTLEIGNTLAGWGNKKNIAAGDISGTGNVIFNSSANTNTGNTNAQLDGGTVNLTGNYTDTGPISITGNLAIESGGVNTSADVTISNVSVLCNRNRNPIFGGLYGLGFVALCAGGGGTFTMGNGNKDGDFSGSINANQNGIDGTLGGGAINITKIGTGRQKFSTNICFVGTTTVSGGILELINSNVCGTIVNNATLIFNNSSAITRSGAISGTGSIIKEDVGVLSLTANNTSFTGPVTVNAGTFYCDYPSAVGSAITVKSGATLSLGENGSGLNIWSAPLTFSGPDSGTDATILFNSMSSLPDKRWSGAVSLNTPTTIRTTQYARDVYFTGIISGTSPLTLSSDGGNHVFSGNNTYSGGTTILLGPLRLNNTSGAGTGVINIGNGTLSLYRSGGTTTYPNSITSTAGTTGFLNVDGSGSDAGVGTNSIYDTGAITVDGTLTIARTTGGNGHTYFSGDVNGAGTLKINNTNGGVAPSGTTLGRCSLNGTFGFTGDVQVLAGGNFLANNVSVNSVDIASGGFWTLGANPATNMLTGSGTITHTASSGVTTTLVVGGTSSTSSFSGVIGQTALGALGTVALTKVGTGTLELIGANTYTGATLITGGTLWFTNAATSLGSTSGFTISGGGNLTLSNGADVTYNKAITWSGTGGTLYTTQPSFGRTFTYTGNWTLNAPASLTSNKGSAGRINIDGVISGGSPLTYGGNTYTWVRGNNNYTGGTTLNSSAYVTCGHINAFGTGTVTVNSGAILNKATCGMTNTVINNGGTVNP